MEPNYSSTPKLTLSKLPCKPIKPPPQILLTPPFQPPLSVPFQWEEAPGKPRSHVDVQAVVVPSGAASTQPANVKNKVARCLDLPPRLLNDDGKMTIMPSPTTVLDGPYVGRSLSLACTLSFRKGPVMGREKKFGSGRWENSFKLDHQGEFGGEGIVDFSRALGDHGKNVKVKRVGRKRSFFSLSRINNSNLWGGIYSSFKQALPWRRRR